MRNDDLLDVPEISRRIHELPKYPKLPFLQKNNNEQFQVRSVLSGLRGFCRSSSGTRTRCLDRGPYADGHTVVVLLVIMVITSEKEQGSVSTVFGRNLPEYGLVVVPGKPQLRTFGDPNQVVLNQLG